MTFTKSARVERSRRDETVVVIDDGVVFVSAFRRLRILKNLRRFG